MREIMRAVVLAVLVVLSAGNCVAGTPANCNSDQLYQGFTTDSEIILLAEWGLAVVGLSLDGTEARPIINMESKYLYSAALIGDRLLADLGGGIFEVIDVASGEVEAVLPWPIGHWDVIGERVYFVSEQKTAETALYGLYSCRFDGTDLKRHGDDRMGGFATDGESLYYIATDRRVVAMDVASGLIRVIDQRTSLYESFSHYCVIDGFIYIVFWGSSGKDGVYRLSVIGGSLEQLCLKADLAKAVNSDGESVYFMDQKAIYAFDLADRELRTVCSIPEFTTVYSLWLFGDYVYTVTFEGFARAHKDGSTATLESLELLY